MSSPREPDPPLRPSPAHMPASSRALTRAAGAHSGGAHVQPVADAVEAPLTEVVQPGGRSMSTLARAALGAGAASLGAAALLVMTFGPAALALEPSTLATSPPSASAEAPHPVRAAAWVDAAPEVAVTQREQELEA
ncbi:hypothetical protein NLU66_15195 [Brachybacterium sp. NBEC-018]|uniref:hypothetical protein n=1 Tax=Brachybacterium sp. NBEC-018 TaxID=2996004 RepID=UPI002174ED87|nr:hypothetical protein [Brachybacterium sp. NBEC-018]UVY83546.1 hypothetical protein NLU66_15195 [Brachybacterium sp. NBEC-018]